jgi:hypothetical protein
MIYRAIWKKKHARVQFDVASHEQVQFDVFEKLSNIYVF